MTKDNDKNAETLLDRAIGYLSPERGARRAAWRHVNGTVRGHMQSSLGYRGSFSSRLDTTWSKSTSATGLAHLRHPVQQGLRDRSRHLERQSALAAGLLDRCVDNVIGCGMSLQAETKNKKFNKDAERLWAKYWERPEQRGMFTGAEVERLGFRSYLRDGDIGAALFSDGLIGMVEGDLIASPAGRLNNGRFAEGVEMSGRGRPVAYHVMSAGRDGRRKSVRVPARDFVFVARRNRLSGTRGEPVFAGMFHYIDQLEGFIEATVTAARVAACFGAVIKSTNAAQGVTNLPTLSAGGTGSTKKKFELEPGLVKYLDPNEDIVQIDPKHPGSQADALITSVVRILGLKLGLPLELAMMDFSRTNFSSARASLMQAYRTFRAMQKLWATQFMARIYRWKVSTWVKQGLLDPGGDIDFFNHTWLPQPWEFLDPVKEAVGKLLSRDIGLTTQKQLLRELGIDFDTWIKQRGSEIEQILTAGIPIVHSSMTKPMMTGGQDDTPEPDDAAQGQQAAEDQDDDADVSGSADDAEGDTGVGDGRGE